MDLLRGAGLTKGWLIAEIASDADKMRDWLSGELFGQEIKAAEVRCWRLCTNNTAPVARDVQEARRDDPIIDPSKRIGHLPEV